MQLGYVGRLSLLFPIALASALAGASVVHQFYSPDLVSVPTFKLRLRFWGSGTVSWPRRWGTGPPLTRLALLLFRSQTIKPLTPEKQAYLEIKRNSL